MSVRILAASMTNRPGANPFPSLWTEAVTVAGAEVTAFSRRCAFRGRFDLLHVHWPEVIISARNMRPRSVLRISANLAALAWLKARGAKIAWTVHNLSPHDSSPNTLTRLATRIFMLMVDEFWVLSEWSARELRSQLGPSAAIRVMKHPRYPLVSPRHESSRVGNVVSFGEVRPYRGYVELCEEFEESAPPATTLTIIGAGRNDDYAERLSDAVSRASNVRWVDTRLSDIELEEAVSASQAVVLRYNRVTNSGAALLALSLNRPVIVPAHDAFLELADEVGQGWVHFYSGNLEADLRAASMPKSAPPDLSRRTWTRLGEDVVRACRDLMRVGCH